MSEPLNRTRIDVVNLGTEWKPRFRAEWGGNSVEATNPFLLDSLLDSIGAPLPRDLHLIEGENDE